MSKILMPSEEWEEFRDSALRQHSPETQAFLKLAFVAGLSSASEFFQNLISCEDLGAAKKQALFQRWMTGITSELENYAGELLRFSEGKNGRTN